MEENKSVPKNISVALTDELTFSDSLENYGRKRLQDSPFHRLLKDIQDASDQHKD